VRKEPSTAYLFEVPRKRVWDLPIIYFVYRLSCYLEASSLYSLLSLGCAILKGISSSRSLGKAPYWPSSIRPLKGLISYPLAPRASC